MDIAIYPFFLHNHFTQAWHLAHSPGEKVSAHVPSPWEQCPGIQEDPNYKLSLLRCDTVGTICAPLWSGSCEDVYKKVALPCPVALISISGASKGFSGSHSKPNSVENRILLALHPVPSQNLKLNSQLKLKLELFLEKPAAPCLCSHPAFCCSDWDYFTSTSERIFQSREEQTKIK